jgi:hypothetical protein
MKLPSLNKPKKRGRKKMFDGGRVNFYLRTKLLEAMVEVETRRKSLKLPYALTKSYLCRAGLRMVIKHLNELMDRAENGDLHAKKRVVKYGEKPIVK